MGRPRRAAAEVGCEPGHSARCWWEQAGETAPKLVLAPFLLPRQPCSSEAGCIFLMQCSISIIYLIPTTHAVYMSLAAQEPVTTSCYFRQHSHAAEETGWVRLGSGNTPRGWQKPTRSTAFPSAGDPIPYSRGPELCVWCSHGILTPGRCLSSKEWHRGTMSSR